jgi:hypothetical protein
MATIESEISVKKSKKNSKAIPVTGRGDLYGCKMLRIPHCLDTGHTLLPINIIFFNISGTHFC